MLEKYLELSRIAQNIEADNRILSDAIIKLTNESDAFNEILKTKDRMIADLIIERDRFKELLKIQKENELKNRVE